MWVKPWDWRLASCGSACYRVGYGGPAWPCFIRAEGGERTEDRGGAMRRAQGSGANVVTQNSRCFVWVCVCGALVQVGFAAGVQCVWATRREAGRSDCGLCLASPGGPTLRHDLPIVRICTCAKQWCWIYSFTTACKASSCVPDLGPHTITRLQSPTHTYVYICCPMPRYALTAIIRPLSLVPHPPPSPCISSYISSVV